VLNDKEKKSGAVLINDDPVPDKYKAVIFAAPFGAYPNDDMTPFGSTARTVGLLDAIKDTQYNTPACSVKEIDPVFSPVLLVSSDALIDSIKLPGESLLLLIVLL
jgi:hypothetical protein